MSRSLMKRLCLGTAQFGLDYGIANSRGMIQDKEIFQILEFAHDSGINALDTAYSYGNSENIIGKFMESGKGFNIISKTCSFGENTVQDMQLCFAETLKRLKQESIYGYLIHDFNNFLLHGATLWGDLLSLKEKKLVKKIGFSLYKPGELEYLLDNDISFDIVQVPYSILDQRFKVFFVDLKKKKVEIHIRSVFLQGLFFLGIEKIKEKFSLAEKIINRLTSISKDTGIPIYALCLCFVLQNNLIDKVVIGIDSYRQLVQNIASLKYMNKIRDIYNDLESLKLNDERVVLPYNWV